jgi:hypothetical protein
MMVTNGSPVTFRRLVPRRRPGQRRWRPGRRRAHASSACSSDRLAHQRRRRRHRPAGCRPPRSSHTILGIARNGLDRSQRPARGRKRIAPERFLAMSKKAGSLRELWPVRWRSAIPGIGRRRPCPRISLVVSFEKSTRDRLAARRLRRSLRRPAPRPRGFGTQWKSGRPVSQLNARSACRADRRNGPCRPACASNAGARAGRVVRAGDVGDLSWTPCVCGARSRQFAAGSSTPWRGGVYPHRGRAGGPPHSSFMTTYGAIRLTPVDSPIGPHSFTLRRPQSNQ